MGKRRLSLNQKPGSKEPGSKEVFEDDLREIIEFVKEIRPKVNSLHETVITADKSLVKKISTIWDDIYTDNGRIVKRIRTIEERYAKTYDRAEQVYTQVLVMGLLHINLKALVRNFITHKPGWKCRQISGKPGYRSFCPT